MLVTPLYYTTSNYGAKIQRTTCVYIQKALWEVPIIIQQYSKHPEGDRATCEF